MYFKREWHYEYGYMGYIDVIYTFIDWNIKLYTIYNLYIYKEEIYIFLKLKIMASNNNLTLRIKL